MGVLGAVKRVVGERGGEKGSEEKCITHFYPNKLRRKQNKNKTKQQQKKNKIPSDVTLRRPLKVASSM